MSEIGETRRLVLDNGITLISEELPHRGTVSVGFWFSIGSAHEDDETRGFSHFIEHILFKGNSELNAFDIAKQIDGVGGSMNAFTSREETCFYANLPYYSIDVFFDIMDVLINKPGFSESDIEMEKEVVLQEIKLYQDNPEELLLDGVMQSLWPTHSLGLPIVGNEKSISSLNREKLLNYYSSRYFTDKLIVSIAGNFNFDQVVKRLSKFEARKSSVVKFVVEVPKAAYGHSFSKKKVEQVHLALITPGVSKSDRLKYPLSLFNLIFGASMSSRLYQNIREKEGLCYSIYSFGETFKTTGLFGIYAATSVKHVKKLLELLHFEINQIIENGIEEEELIHAKKQLAGNMILAKESVEGRMDRNAYQELYQDRITSLSEVIDIVNNITMVEMEKIIDLLFRNGHFALNTIGHADHIKIVKKNSPW